MDKRRILLAVVFVALCLSLSGLLLRRQIAAHPKPKIEMLATNPDSKIWHLDTGPVKKGVTDSILAQLAAIRTGDADKANFYQSSGLRRNFASPQQFVRSIATHYPEFGHCRSAEFGPVWVDKSGRFAQVVVLALGEDGQHAQGRYLLVREDGVYRVAGVAGGSAIH